MYIDSRGPMTELRPRPVSAPASPLPPLPRVDPITHLPIVILYPHSRCNCRCMMCDIWRITTKREITPAEVGDWVGGFVPLGVRRVVLSGGEPLMHSDVWALCDVLRSAGIGITILTTGLLLEKRAAKLVAYCDDIIISLDGPESVHDLIRNVRGAYQRIAEGVRAVRSADPAVAISGRCTVQRANYRHLRDTVRAARDLGLERISFLAVDVSTDAFNRPGGWEANRARDVLPGPDDLPILEAELRALEADHGPDFADGFIAEPPEKLRRRLYQYFAAHLGHGEFPGNDCNAPWVSTVIEVDGTVRPCFFQPALGNIREAGSLDVVLNAPSAQAWRRDLDTQRDPICRKCVCSLSLRQASEPVPAV